MLGEQVDRYRITAKLGEGGMAVVYIAEHTSLDRKAVVKVLRQRFLLDEEIAKRFMNEASSMASIHHPGIVDVMDVGYHKGSGQLYILMEYLEGENLRDRLDRVGSVSIESALSICRQAADALGAAHAKGIVHRDLKPANVFLVQDSAVPGGERAKIFDFGLAKLMGNAHSDLVTRSGVLMGTPMYMSPEQCRGAGSVDHRTDLYALGCILFELLCGRPPFFAIGVGDLIAAHLWETPPPVTTYRADAPPEVEALIQRLLAKDPGRRVGSAAELVAELAALSGATVATATAAATPAGPAPAQRPRPGRVARTLPAMADEVSAAPPAAERATGQASPAVRGTDTLQGQPAPALRAPAASSEPQAAGRDGAVAIEPAPAVHAPSPSAPMQAAEPRRTGPRPAPTVHAPAPSAPMQAAGPAPAVHAPAPSAPMQAAEPRQTGPIAAEPRQTGPIAAEPRQTGPMVAERAQRLPGHEPPRSPPRRSAPARAAAADVLRDRADRHDRHAAAVRAAEAARAPTSDARGRRLAWLAQVAVIGGLAVASAGYLVFWMLDNYRAAQVAREPDATPDAQRGGAPAEEPALLAARATRRRPALLAIPGGQFVMGSPIGDKSSQKDEKPPHPVTVDAFWLCQTEVTQSQWRAVMRSNPSDCDHGCGSERPVQDVSWYDAVAYLNELSRREGLSRCYEIEGESVRWDRGCTGYRLPTEAEWEYAARAGEQGSYGFGDDAEQLELYGWYAANAKNKVAPVAGKRANAWGAYDMHGNVWEWVWDEYAMRYPDEPQSNPAGPAGTGPVEGQQKHVVRGGSFLSDAAMLRSAARAWSYTTNRGPDNGVRCARAAPAM